MRTVAALPAFLCGIAVVVIARALPVAVGAQPMTGEGVFDVCADAEGVMRLIEPAATCGPGERRVRLRGPELEKACEPVPPKDLSDLARRVAELEGRGGDQQASPVIAPFEVVNPAGIRVFYLEQSTAVPELIGTEIYNETGARVAVIAANARGGALSVTSGTSAPEPEPAQAAVPAAGGTVSAAGPDVELSLYAGSERRLQLGRRPNGRYSLSILRPGDRTVAAIGEAQIGTGLAMVADGDGRQRVAMFRDRTTGAGFVQVTNAAGAEVASLTTWLDAGLLRLRNRSGEIMVEAGRLDTGVGMVRAGPGAFQHGIGFLGLPASYIVGKKQ